MQQCCKIAEMQYGGKFQPAKIFYKSALNWSISADFPRYIYKGGRRAAG